MSEQYEEFEYDTGEFHRPSWWDRWQTRRAFKREQRAERRAQRAWERKQARLDRVALSLHLRQQAHPHLYMGHHVLTTAMEQGTIDQQVDAAEQVRLGTAAMRDRRFRYVAAIGTWLTLLLVTIMATCSGCARGHTPRKPTMGTARGLTEQMTAAIEIVTPCGRGSGVLLSDTEALTALHVVQCKHKPSTVITVHTWDSRTYSATPLATDDARDLARIRLAAPVSFEVAPVRIAYPVPTESITQPCVVTAVPKRDHLFGAIKSVKTSETDDKVHVDAPVWFGNSGSALYNEHGDLVGILTKLHWCGHGDEALWEVLGFEPERKCGGWAASPLGSGVL